MMMIRMMRMMRLDDNGHGNGDNNCDDNNNDDYDGEYDDGIIMMSGSTNDDMVSRIGSLQLCLAASQP